MLQRALLALATVLAAITFSVSAFADAGTVLYSYEKIEIGSTQQYVLLPRADLSLKGAPTATHIKRAFTNLKKAKRSSYGKAAISVKGNKAATAKVTVRIDPKYGKYSLIVIAETVATLTEMGVKAVEFPGYTSGPMSRKDLPFPLYALQIPLWRALPSLSAPHTQVVMPDGSLRTPAEVTALFKKKDPSVIEPLYTYLKAKDAYTVTLVAKALPALKVPYAEQVAALLKHKRRSVRTTALKVLAPVRNQPVVADAVVAFLKAEKEAKLAVSGAEFLGKVKDKKYSIEKPLYYLAKGDEKQAVAAAKALASFKGSRAIPALVGHLVDKRKPVAVASALALETSKAIDAQEKALKNSKIDGAIRLQIARDLSNDKAVAQRLAGLNYLVLNAPEDESTKAIVTMNKIKDDAARTTLQTYVTSDKKWARRTSAEVLAKRGHVESVGAYAKAINAKKDVKLMEAFAYQVMVSQPLKVVLDQTKSKNPIVKRVAYSALGERAQKEKAGSKVFKILTAGLASRDPLIRGACARAIGSFANKKAAAALKKVAKDKNAGVRRDVAVAAGKFKGTELLEELNGYLADKDADVQAAATISLGKRGEAGAWNTFKGMTKHKSPAVRAAAMTTLAKLVSRDDKTGVNQVISILSGGIADDALEVRLATIDALGTFKEEKAVTSIALQLNAEDEDLRLAAIRAMGNTRHPSAAELVHSVSADPSTKVRREAIIALGKLGSKAHLTERAKNEKDADLLALIKKAQRGK